MAIDLPMTKADTNSKDLSQATLSLMVRRLESENQNLRREIRSLQTTNGTLELISRSFLSINSSLELDHVLTAILDEIQNVFGVVGSSIWIKDSQTNAVVCHQAAGFQSDLVKGWRLAPGEGIAGWVSSYGEKVILQDTKNDARHFGEVAEKMEIELRSLISVPMRVKGTVIGALQMVDKQVNRFDVSHANLLQALADASATAIENAQLFERANREIAERKRTENKLKESRKALKEKSLALEEVNTALNVLLQTRAEDQVIMEDSIVANVKDLVLPFLEKLSQSKLDEKQAVYVEIIQSNIADIVSPFLRQLPMKFFDLTPTEIQIADLVRKNKTTKEIACILNASEKTIEAHRNRLRKKLGLTNQRIQLRDYLMTLV